MGTIIETDAEVADAGEIITPASQALAWFEPGGDAPKSLRNLAVPSVPGALVHGAFVGASGFMTLGGNSGDALINTGVPQPDNFTAFVVVRRSPDAAVSDVRVLSAFSGNTSGGDSKGFSLRFTASGNMSYLHGSGASSPTGSVPNTPAAVLTEWRLLAIQVVKGVSMGVRDLTAGQGSLAAVPLSGGEVKGPDNFHLGSNPARISGATIDLALAAIYGTALNDAQIAEVVAFIRSEMAITMPGAAI